MGSILLPPIGLLGRPPGPEGGGASTSQGHPYAIYQRAMARGNVLSALAEIVRPRAGLGPPVEFVRIELR